MKLFPAPFRTLATGLASALFLSTLAAGRAAAQGLYTDQADYPPGEMALLVGVGYTAGEVVTLQVLHADGTPDTGADHLPWTVTANAKGYVLASWHVCEDDCVGALLRATADGATSGLHTEVLFTDDLPPCTSGTGVVTMVATGGSCLDETPPAGNGPYNFEVAEGGSYTMTISGVTECSGDTITVFVQNSSTGNFCFNATGSGGTYVGSFTMPNPACNTSPVSYKCGADAPCSNQDTFDARGPGGACTVHLRASTFDANCNKTGDDSDCAGACVCDSIPVLNYCIGCDKTDVPPFGTCAVWFDLGCNPTSLPDCDPNITASDNCGPVQVHCGIRTAAPIGCLNIRGVTHRAHNDCGEVICVAAYFWTEDSTPPAITPPPDLSVDCSASTSASDTGWATATDSCDDKPTITHSDVDAPGACTGSHVITRTWMAADDCGNSASCVQTITVSDSTGPLISCPPDVGVDCSASTDPCSTGSAEASDACSGVASIDYSDVDAPGACAGSHVITRTWTATDGCGNSSNCVQTISVNDTSAPTICCPGPVSANGSGQCCVPVCIGMATASDNCSGVTITNDAPAQFCVGDTSVTWTAMDGCGNASTCRQTVTVLGQICATKFYDSNANGVQDSGELGIEGWLIEISGTPCLQGSTDSNGQVCFDLPAGTYDVSEVMPSEDNWTATTPTTVSLTIGSGNCAASCSFGNYCYDDLTGGLTQGYWTSSQGARVLSQNDPAWRTLLNDLNLRTSNGSDFDVSTSASFKQAYGTFRNWALGASAASMTNMLSVQLAAASLASHYGSLNSNALVVVPGGVRTAGNLCMVSFLGAAQPVSCGGPPLLSLTSVPGSTTCGCTSNNGVVRIGNLFSRADCLLSAYPSMPAGTPQRFYGESVKNLLDMINNNGNNGYPCGGISQVINSGDDECEATFR